MNTNKTGGFTLLELVVAIGIFSVVLVIIMGLYSRFTFMQRRDIAEQKLLEDVRFGLELFNREARTAFGSTYSLPDLDGSGQSLRFRNQNGHCVLYRFREGRLQRIDAGIGGPDHCPMEVFEGGAPATLFGAEVVIESLRFFVTPARFGGEGQQGTITLVMRAGSRNPSVQPIHMQSTLTSRQVIPYTPDVP